MAAGILPRIQISKPWKNPTNPSNYRPVALTSVLCKVMEWIVNVRLLDFFDLKGTLSTLQCGNRSKRTFVDQLFISGSHSKEGPSKQWVSRIHLLRHGNSIQFTIETRHPIGLKRSRNRRENVQLHTRLSQTQIKLLLNTKKFVAQLPNDNRIQISLYMDGPQILVRMQSTTFHAVFESFKETHKGVWRHPPRSARSMHLLQCICTVLILLLQNIANKKYFIS